MRLRRCCRPSSPAAAHCIMPSSVTVQPSSRQRARLLARRLRPGTRLQSCSRLLTGYRRLWKQLQRRLLPSQPAFHRRLRLLALLHPPAPSAAAARRLPAWRPFSMVSKLILACRRLARLVPLALARGLWLGRAASARDHPSRCTAPQHCRRRLRRACAPPAMAGRCCNWRHLPAVSTCCNRT